MVTKPKFIFVTFTYFSKNIKRQVNIVNEKSRLRKTVYTRYLFCLLFKDFVTLISGFKKLCKGETMLDQTTAMNAYNERKKKQSLLFLDTLYRQ
jgi:hypothetical protein